MLIAACLIVGGVLAIAGILVLAGFLTAPFLVVAVIGLVSLGILGASIAAAFLARRRPPDSQ